MTLPFYQYLHIRLGRCTKGNVEFDCNGIFLFGVIANENEDAFALTTFTPYATMLAPYHVATFAPYHVTTFAPWHVTSTK